MQSLPESNDMEPISNTLCEYWNSWGRPILAGLFGGGAAIGIAKLFLENHLKTKLDTHVETLKFDLNKQMLHAELVTKNKHEIYPKLFQLMSIADGAIGGLSGIQRVLTFQEYDRNDFENYLKRNEVMSAQRKIILDKWDLSREEGVKEWRNYEKILQQSKAEKSLTDARNYFFLNGIYISDKIREKSENVFKLLRELLTYRIFPEGLDREDYAKIRDLDKKISEELDQLRKQMKAELDFA